jgi:hypothetical protein
MKSGTGTRVFTPQVRYTKHGWFAEVFINNSTDAYWRGSRLTKLGAQFAARHKARKYNRLERRGLVA